MARIRKLSLAVPDYDALVAKAPIGTLAGLSELLRATTRFKDATVLKLDPGDPVTLYVQSAEFAPVNCCWASSAPRCGASLELLT